MLITFDNYFFFFLIIFKTGLSAIIINRYKFNNMVAFFKQMCVCVCVCVGLDKNKIVNLTNFDERLL